MKISRMIKKLEEIKNEHGDLDLYVYTNFLTVMKADEESLPTVSKIHYKKHEDYEALRDEMHEESLDTPDEDIFDIDLKKPIVKGVVI